MRREVFNVRQWRCARFGTLGEDLEDCHLPIGVGWIVDLEKFVEKYGPWAVIAGGSEGLGASFADQLTDAGLGVVLLGRKIEPLDEEAARLGAKGAQVRTLSVDLSADDVAARVGAVTDDLDVGLLVYNAGSNSY